MIRAGKSFSAQKIVRSNNYLQKEIERLTAEVERLTTENKTLKQKPPIVITKKMAFTEQEYKMANLNLTIALDRERRYNEELTELVDRLLSTLRLN